MLALGGQRAGGGRGGFIVAGVALVLLGQEIHRVMDPVQVAAGDVQVTRPFGPAGQHDRVVIGQQLVDRYVLANLDASLEGDALGRHLIDAAIDEVLFHLEVGDAIAQQPADAVLLFDQRHRVARPGKLLRTGHAGGAGADDGNGFSGLHRGRLRDDPTLFPRPIDDRAFDRLDGHGVVVDVQRAGRLTRGGANAAGEFGEIVGGVQVDRCLFPLIPVNQIVPVGDLVVDRAAVVTERNTAIHAAGGLTVQFLGRQRLDELLERLHPNFGLFVCSVVTVDFEETGNLTHLSLLIAPTGGSLMVCCIVWWQDDQPGFSGLNNVASIQDIWAPLCHFRGLKMIRRFEPAGNRFPR